MEKPLCFAWALREDRALEGSFQDPTVPKERVCVCEWDRRRWVSTKYFCSHGWTLQTHLVHSEVEGDPHQVSFRSGDGLFLRGGIVYFQN